jgi:hypothetical protein
VPNMVEHFCNQGLRARLLIVVAGALPHSFGFERKSSARPDWYLVRPALRIERYDEDPCAAIRLGRSHSETSVHRALPLD